MDVAPADGGIDVTPAVRRARQLPEGDARRGDRDGQVGTHGKVRPLGPGRRGPGGSRSLPAAAAAAVRSAARREEPRRARSRAVPSPPPPPPRRGEGALPRRGGEAGKARASARAAPGWARARRGGRGGAGAGRGSLAPEGPRGASILGVPCSSLFRSLPAPPRLKPRWNRHCSAAQGLPEPPGPEPPRSGRARQPPRPACALPWPGTAERSPGHPRSCPPGKGGVLNSRIILARQCPSK